MNKLQLNILKAENHINKKKYMFSSIYPFTTENIKGYYNQLFFNDKDILTVGSSGDHIFNLLLKDINSVDYFDVNPFTEYYFNLKKAAIITLEYDEFLDFFCFIDYPKIFKKNYNAFNIEIYNKIRNNLDSESIKFWDYLLTKYNNLRNTDLFSKDEEPVKVLKKINEYLLEENYYSLKQKLNINSNFIECNILRLEEKLNKKYDIINLSNIACYLDMLFDGNYLNNYKKIIDKLEEKLKDDGYIILSYLYEIDEIFKYSLPDIYNISLVEELFKNIEILKFDAITSMKYHCQKDIKDGIIIKKKTKK